MPCALDEYNAFSISPASEALSGNRRCWRCQNCITMAMLAAPQPFFACFTNGTSSHTLDGSATHKNPHASIITAVWLSILPKITPLSELPR